MQVIVWLASRLVLSVGQGIAPLKDALLNEGDDQIQSAAAWALCQVGRHTAGMFLIFVHVLLHIMLRPEVVHFCFDV
jgi:hypothetical protein